MISPLPILYEDNHLLVLNKPAGLLTQPSGTDQASLEQQAKEWLKEVYQKPGRVFLEAAHRLDKPVSGVAVFCKTSKALARVHESIRAKQTKKQYVAWVDYLPSQNEGTLEHFLIHDDHCAQVVSAFHSHAKLARLTYRLIEVRGEGALLEIDLETGRYHQIRVQLAEMGCPIRGDCRYGSHQPLEPEAIALHHIRLRIPHPITKEECLFEAPLSPFFRFKQ